MTNLQEKFFEVTDLDSVRGQVLIEGIRRIRDGGVTVITRLALEDDVFGVLLRSVVNYVFTYNHNDSESDVERNIIYFFKELLPLLRPLSFCVMTGTGLTDGLMAETIKAAKLEYKGEKRI